MGQRHLPKELQTQKTKSLSGELKSIAEELIADKFDVKEEVVTKRGSSFRRDVHSSQGEYTVGIDMGFGSDETAFTGLREITDDTEMVSFRRTGPGVTEKIDFFSRKRCVSTPIVKPDTYGVQDALQRLDCANAPRNGRKAIVSPKFAHELKSSPYFAHYAYRDERHRGSREQYLATVFGVPVFVVPDAYCEMTA